MKYDFIPSDIRKHPSINANMTLSRINTGEG